MQGTVKTIEDLREKYPKIFKDYEGNHGRVNWDCPEGWVQLVDIMCHILQLQSGMSEKNPQIECMQIKEKFGGLRFYPIGGLTEYQQGIINYAEILSFSTCMTCGSMKNVKQTSGWIGTYCEEHFPKK